MGKPTQAELREVDKRLREAGYADATIDAIRANDRKHAARRAYGTDIEDIAYCPRLAEYCLPKIKIIANRILRGQKRACFNWWANNLGITYSQIGYEMGISKATVREHLSRAIVLIINDPECGVYEVLLLTFGEKQLSQAGYS